MQKGGYSTAHVDAALERLEDAFAAEERQVAARLHGGEAWLTRGPHDGAGRLEPARAPRGPALRPGEPPRARIPRARRRPLRRQAHALLPRRMADLASTTCAPWCSRRSAAGTANRRSTSCSTRSSTSCSRSADARFDSIAAAPIHSTNRGQAYRNRRVDGTGASAVAERVRKPGRESSRRATVRCFAFARRLELPARERGRPVLGRHRVPRLRGAGRALRRRRRAGVRRRRRVHDRRRPRRATSSRRSPSPRSHPPSTSASSGWAPPAVTPDPGSAQAYAAGAVAARGWPSSEFDCLVALWSKESGWRVNAYNASSGAYGIPQALPGSKMATAGADWETNAGDPDRVGPRLRPGPLRHALRRVGALAGRRLVLSPSRGHERPSGALARHPVARSPRRASSGCRAARL